MSSKNYTVSKGMDRKTERIQRTRKLAMWTLAWVLSEALVVFGSEFLWEGRTGITLLALALNVGLGLGMIGAHRNLLRSCDELERKIHLESMGLTLGLTLVIGLAYSMLDITNVIPWDAEISFLVIFMAITYIVTLIANSKRYR